MPYFFSNWLFICHLGWVCVREATKAIQPVMNTSGTQGQWSFECNILWPGPQNNLGPAQLPITVESFWINAEGLVCFVLALRSSTFFYFVYWRWHESVWSLVWPELRYHTRRVLYPKRDQSIQAWSTPCPARCINAFEQLKAHACMNMQFMNISE